MSIARITNRLGQAVGITTEAAPAAQAFAVKKATKTDFSHLKGKPEDISVADVNNLGQDYMNAMGEDASAWRLQFHHNQKHAKKLAEYTNDSGKASDHFTFLLGVLNDLVKENKCSNLYNNINSVFKLSFNLSDNFFKGNKDGVVSRLETKINSLKLKELTNGVAEVEILDEEARPTRRPS